MNEDDGDLRDAFARLRDAERHSVPPFRIGSRRRPVLQLAFATLLLIMLVVAGYVARKPSAPHPLPPAGASLSTWRAPTDFLLQTPGRELLDSTPQLQSQSPAINIPGGRS